MMVLEKLLKDSVIFSLHLISHLGSRLEIK